MPYICKCCGKKIGFLDTSEHLSDEYNEPICTDCMNPIRSGLSSLRRESDLENFKVKKPRFARIVDRCNYSEEGKQYVLSYADSLEKNLIKRDQQKKEKEEHERRTQEFRAQHQVTTGYNFEGYCIRSYIGVMSGSVVLGTGFFSEFSASVSDFFGTESNSFSKKMEDARESALSKLKDKSAEAGGNALIGVDFDYITFANNMVGVVASGTSVLIEKEEGKLA